MASANDRQRQSMPFVCVTGSSGFVGHNMANWLESRGFPVKRLSHSDNFDNKDHVNFMDVNSLAAAFSGADILIHAGWKGVNSVARRDLHIQSQNILIAENVIRAVSETSISKIIGLGSQDEFGDAYIPWSENQETHPTTEYGIAKKRVADLLEEAGGYSAWVRIFSVYGPGDARDSVVLKVLRALKYRQALDLGACKNKWAAMHVDDLGSGIESVIENNLSGRMNLAPIEAPPLRSQLEVLINLSGRAGLVTFNDREKESREIQTLAGHIHASGWKPSVELVAGFNELWKSALSDDAI